MMSCLQQNSHTNICVVGRYGRSACVPTKGDLVDGLMAFDIMCDRVGKDRVHFLEGVPATHAEVRSPLGAHELKVLIQPSRRWRLTGTSSLGPYLLLRASSSFERCLQSTMLGVVCASMISCRVHLTTHPPLDLISPWPLLVRSTVTLRDGRLSTRYTITHPRTTCTHVGDVSCG